MTGYHDISASEEHCSLCGAQASHKVAEDAPDTRTSFWRRHPFTNYLCCGCFGRIMGSLAVEWCARESGVPVGGGEPQPTTSTDNDRLEPPPGVSAETWDTFLNAKVRIWFCPEDSDHRVEWDDDGATCLDCGRKSTPVRSAGGGDQPDTPCPECGGSGRVWRPGYDGIQPCPACTDKETPHGP